MTKKDRKRFCVKFKVDKMSDCWEWNAAKTKNGYGQFYLKGKLSYAHRIAYVYVHGTIEEGLDLDHLCRNRACVNPGHLEPVTRQENLKRGKGNQHKDKKYCKNGHPFNDTNTYVTNNRRVCRICGRNSLHKYRARLKQEGDVK